MRQNQKRFSVFLLIYSLVLLLIVGFGLCLFWQYLEAYEQSLPQGVVSDYEQNILAGDFEEYLQEYANAHATSLQSGDEIYKYLKTQLEDCALQVRKAAFPESAGKLEYKVFKGELPVGKFFLERSDEELPFGFRSYSITDKFWELPGDYAKEYTVIAPQEARIRVNQILLTESNAETDIIPIPPTTLTKEYGGAANNRYRFFWYGEPEFQADKDPLLLFFAESPSAYARSYTASVRWEHCWELAKLAEQFIRDYTAYGAKAVSYGNVLRHLVPNSEMYRRITGSVDGMKWSKGTASEVRNFSIESFSPYADAVICEAHYDLDYIGGTYRTNLRLLMVQTESGWKILNMEIV